MIAGRYPRFAVSSLLVTLIGFSLIGPAVIASKGVDLPECCRKNGKHHCAMSGAKVPGSYTSRGPAIDVSTRCGFFPTGAQVAIQSFYAGARPVCGDSSPRSLTTPALCRIDISSSGSFPPGWLKRGPPPSLLS